MKSPEIDSKGMRDRVSDALEKFFEGKDLKEKEQRIVSYWHYSGGCSSCAASNSVSNTASEYENFEDNDETGF